MDWKNIDRLRDPGFTVARRGYDQREVDRFLSSLVEWLETDAATDLGRLTLTSRRGILPAEWGRSSHREPPVPSCFVRQPVFLLMAALLLSGLLAPLLTP